MALDEECACGWDDERKWRIVGAGRVVWGGLGRELQRAPSRSRAVNSEKRRTLEHLPVGEFAMC